MEEKKEKKKLNKKPLLICLAIALVFAIIGIVDIKSNAAEVTTYTAEITGGLMEYRTDGTSGWWSNSGGTWILTSDSPMYGFYNNTYDVPTNARGQDGNWWVISKSPIYGYKEDSVSVGVNGEVWYLVGYCPNWGMSSDGSTRLVVFYGTGLTVKHIPNIYSGGIREVIAAYMDGSLEVIIDYSTLPVDDEMPVPSDVKVNKIVDSTEHKKIYYDYITWLGSSTYDVQVEVSPWVYVYENEKLGFGYGKFLEDFNCEFLVTNILGKGSSNYTFEVFDTYYPEMDYLKDFVDFYKNVDSHYPSGNFTDYHNFYSVGYRLRFIDTENEKAGPWVYVEPNRNNLGEYCSYVVYSDSSFSSDNSATGSNNNFTQGTFDDAVANIDKENEFKEKYDVVDGDVDTQEATNWLYSVVNFIKGTPQVVGSVLGFLPQPILYGMYVTIFLGVIASGLAIIKALF